MEFISKHIDTLYAILFLTLVLAAIVILVNKPAHAAEVTVAWDANTEADLAGYKIYIGAVSRGNITDLIEKWCTENESGRYDDCVKEWEAICKDDETRSCHSLLFGYDRFIDVGNVTQYTITNLIPGQTYFLAATAYDNENNESAFSDELIHTVAYASPLAPGQLKPKPEVIRFNSTFSDPIKGKIDTSEDK